ncbi:hypothetical protein Patl1_28850 [Pistacia atlantica]|uniref:Uncharacterized protein n=1 Tax=Pistacia atlantica TaxID=434234 RepID=A0ACC1BCM3_9ROSI|nr:hypothetical protein Patl1_28850 [Pistacia atlantica]
MLYKFACLMQIICHVPLPSHQDSWTWVTYLLCLGSIAGRLQEPVTLVSEDLLLFPNQLLLVPITCGCTGNQYFANITYQIKKGDSYYLVSINSFENLTKWQVVKEMNPSLNPNLLQVGENVTFPLFCQCPSKTHLEKGIEYLITKRRTLSRNGSSLESSDLIPVRKFGNSESFGPKIIQDKLLPGVSGYLSKPIVYEIKVIMEATMNLSEHYRIGRSVYRATINGKVLAVKNIKENVTEELSILQRVNHANLVKLIGVSSDFEGNRLLVYEYAENGSLGKWLHPKSSEISEVLKIEEKREQRLRNWMDPYLESFYPIDGAISLATLARACTLEKPLSRPSMGEVVFGLSILAHSSETLERSWTTGLEAEEVLQVISPVKAR